MTALAATGLLAFSAIEPLQIGSEMPKADVKMQDINGKEITLKQAMKKTA